MAVNIIDLVKNVFTSDVLSKAGNALGENEHSIGKAVGGIIPTVLIGLLTKFGSSGTGGLGSMINSAKDLLGGNNNISGSLGNIFSGRTEEGGLLSKGGAILKGIFGDKLNGITSLISGYAGIKESTAHSLLSAAAPAALGAIGNYTSQNNMSESDAASFLAGQRENIVNSVPSGLNIASALGLGSLSGLGATTTSSYNPPTRPTHSSTEYTGAPAKKSGGWLMWLLLLVLAALVLWYLLGRKGCNNEQSNVAPVTDTIAVMPVEPAPTTTTVVTRESVKVQLPNGTELDAYKGGIEDQLVTFLKTDYKALGGDSLKKIWFDFDNLNFETGSAKITAESQAQIDNLSAILKAFPKAELKIGGYTDKTGNEDANKKLSGERAKAVKEALKTAGVGSQVKEAEGYGSEFAKYPAEAPEEDRVKDRHVSVSVRG